MCGIAGIYNIKTQEAVNGSLLKAMTDAIVHRGPDEEGFYISGSVGLGHRRLSIIDLEGGHQPLSNEDQSVWVAFNGEIYNFKELKEDLVYKGHTFKTNSDTEVIAHLYEEKEEECFRYLRGMFAIAIWDQRKKKLILGRDRVGKKPLFYLYDGSRVVFASEMKAILEVPGIRKDVNLEAVSDYFSFLYVPAPKSIFKSIRKVLPGHYLVFSEKGERDEEYWDISFGESIERSEEEWCERILATLEEAVRLRLISDVPLGAFLSGGIDSSAVVTLMTKLTGNSVVTTSIGFEEKEFDELQYARMVASLNQSRHYEQIVCPDAVGIIEKLSWHYDEPFADSSAIPTYYVSQVARENVTVALSGDGGDELFGGYRRYIFDKRENQTRSFLPPNFRKYVFGSLAALYPKADWAPRVLRGKTTFQNLVCSHIEGYYRSVSALKPELKNELFHKDLLQELSGYNSLNVLKEYYDRLPHHVDPLSRIFYVDIKTYLPDDILAKVDRASMAHSLEVRAPLLDHVFMELAATIPSTCKVKGVSGKVILKKALESILPHDILYRKKMGFGVPLAMWFRHDLKEMTASLLFNSRSDHLLNSSTVEKIWKEHQSGLRDRSTELWTIFIFQLWRNRVGL